MRTSPSLPPMVGSLAHARGRQGFRRLQSHSPPVLECTEAHFLAAVAEMKVRVGMRMPNTTTAHLQRSFLPLWTGFLPMPVRNEAPHRTSTLECSWDAAKGLPQ